MRIIAGKLYKQWTHGMGAGAKALPGAKGIEAVLPRTNSRVFWLACGRRRSAAELRACNKLPSFRESLSS